MLETCLNCHLFHLIFLQADLTQRAAEITELRNRLAVTETASAKAKDDLALSLTTAKQLKKYFEAERTTWEVQRNALEKRAKDAEEALNPVTQELTGLKRQIELMTSAVFGKYLTCTCLHLCNLCSTPV